MKFDAVELRDTFVAHDISDNSFFLNVFQFVFETNHAMYVFLAQSFFLKLRRVYH